MVWPGGPCYGGAHHRGSPESEGLTNSCIPPSAICWDAGGSPQPDAADVDTDASDGACVRHAECSSEVCDVSGGVCVEPERVVYVALSGTDGGTCGSQSTPCRRIAGAQGGLAKVTTVRRWLRVRAGTFDDSVAVDGATVIVIGSGMGETVIQPATGNAAGFLATNSANLTLDGLTITGATGGFDADGVRCASDAAVTLREVALQANQGDGLDLSGCTGLVEASLTAGTASWEYRRSAAAITSSRFAAASSS